MRVHTSEFKDNIKLFGRELDSIITYDVEGITTTLDNESLNSVSLHYEGAILKSVMKQLDIDSNVEIPVGTEINYQFGIKTRYEDAEDYRDNYDYIDYGNYIVYKVEKQEDTSSYKITCYDKILYAMKDYESMSITYPITIRNYISAICTYLGITFANSSDNFANYNREIPYELYLDNGGNSLNYTFRDVLDELAQVTASTICINADDELEIRYITDANDTIDEEYLKDVNVNFGEKYGPINSVVLSRSAESDNVYLKDDTSIENDGLCEIKIIDNQIMNRNDRSDYLPDIFSKLGGLEYYLNDFSSTGICYYDLCDRYTINIGEEYYSCVMLNDEINITQGLEENIYTEMPEQGETDYTKADKTDRKINQTYLIVDKQNNAIEGMSSQITEQNEEIASIRIQYNEIVSKISDVADITTSAEDTDASVNLTDINASQPISIKIHPIVENICYLYPYSGLYPSSTLYSKSRTLRFTNTSTNEIFDWIIPTDLWYFDSNTYDELELSYGDGSNSSVIVTRKCKINADNSVSILTTPTTETYAYPSDLVLTDGNYTVSLVDNTIGYLYVQLMAKNIYTTQFYTKAETNSIISQTANQINLGVSQTLSNYSTTNEMNSAITLKANEINSVVSQKVGNNEIISKINQTPEAITINANKISLAGKTINMTSDNVAISSTNFSVTSAGNITAKGGTIGGWSINPNYLGKTTGNYNFEIRTDRGASDPALLVWDNGYNRYNWYVTPSGYMYGRNCNITGTISSSSGNIGGWTINGNGLYSSAGGYSVWIDPYALSTQIPGDTEESRAWWSIVMNYPSDIKTKNNVKFLTNKYEKFYDELIPVSFEYKDEYEERKKGSTHFGFVAQDIEKNIEKNNIEDLAMIFGTKLLKLNKEEIIALNTWQIQKLKNQVQEQQEIIDKLIQRIEKLERESDK